MIPKAKKVPQQQKQPSHKKAAFVLRLLVNRWSIGDSNPWPQHCERCALPTVLMPHIRFFHRHPFRMTHITIPRMAGICKNFLCKFSGEGGEKMRAVLLEFLTQCAARGGKAPRGKAKRRQGRTPASAGFFAELQRICEGNRVNIQWKSNCYNQRLLLR